MTTPTKILIDTDIGGDIDDALALALALNSPEVEIVGITTVYLANEWRANLTKNMLKIYDRADTPVAIGAGKPLNGWWDESRIPNSGKDFGQIAADGFLPCACDFIVECAEKYDDLTIVAIGPLTNVALALAKAPHIAKKARLLMMGGQVTKAHPEWNIVCDPEAAKAVFESGIDITMAGLDVTNQCTFTQEDIAHIKSIGNPRTNLLGEMLDTFVEKFKFLPVLHDPLALSQLLWQDIMTLEEKLILVETRGEYTRGVTVDCDWQSGTNTKVATAVNAAEFKRRLLDRITR